MSQVSRYLVQAIAALFCVVTFGIVTVGAQDDLSKQILLKDADIQGFMSIQGDMKTMARKIEASGDVLSPEVRSELDAMSKKHGFADFATLQLVAANIAGLLAGFDPDTGAFQDPRADLRADIAEIEADDKLDPAEKDRVKKELEAELAETPEIKFKENIALIKKYREDIEKALE
ncbi:MAG: hypothetical protein ACRBCJ_13415 [Hyphomicrobiaceae bacterium]